MTRIFLLAALAAATVAAPAVAQDRRDFRLMNRTGYTVSEVYVSPVSTNDWEEDVMGRDMLSNGEYVDISFAGRGGCNYDLKLVYDDGEEAVWNRINLCRVSVVRVTYDSDGNTNATFE